MMNSNNKSTESKSTKIFTILVFILVELIAYGRATADLSASHINPSDIINEDSLTACQHLRRAEARRAKSLGDNSIRIPKCSQRGEFEQVQCSNEIGNETVCWCVDEYGVEIAGTRTENRRQNMTCQLAVECPASSCRMFCPAGFARDLRSGCSVCRCRDPCDGVKCPGGTECQSVNVKCSSEPCPPVPSCRRRRSLSDMCPFGQPLPINNEIRPFLCGLEPGKPTCPPLYKCLVQNGNEYGVCCPASLSYEKPGMCPTSATTSFCSTQCKSDIECPQMQKCCYTQYCGQSCQQPQNLTVCHQVKLLADALTIGEREGRGYVPDCSGPNGNFASKQCSRNGLVCWCVEPLNGNKIDGTMGAADMVKCDGVEATARQNGRSLDDNNCDKHICAAVCEYGFKNDHEGCPTCECSDPCENFQCAAGSHCEIAVDQTCQFGTLCSSEPVCKPNLVYSNPCDYGVPLADNVTSELVYCHQGLAQAREFQSRSFWDEDPIETGRSLSNTIECPSDYICIKLHRETGSVCCPKPPDSEETSADYERQQSMCEYLRDFNERMEGTEDGMALALIPPTCRTDGHYEAVQCRKKTIKVKRSDEKRVLEDKSIREMRKLLAKSRSIRSPNEGRAAKIIDQGDSTQLLGDSNKKKKPEEGFIEVEIEECWCVDGFGTEIPKTKSENTSLEYCNGLRETLECLDVTCRMACDYGFLLDPVTRCPTCDCRSPCDGVECKDGHECRIVEVSCENEYCPPVPACMPRKPGQCPYLVPPGYDSYDDSCDFECRSDYHCDGNKRCCSNGCGTQCVEPELKTACQHLQSLQLHQSIELGVPAKDKYISQCTPDGGFETVQCGPGNVCWCVDEFGKEKSGTRTTAGRPNCEIQARLDCGPIQCGPCEHGYVLDENSCKTCKCKEPCQDITCPRGEECELIKVECTDQQLCSLPICVPIRDSVCIEGTPFKLEGREIMCGPENDLDTCPSTHTCQMDPVSKKGGVCCLKTRDACFESLPNTCSNGNTADAITKWRFSPKHNKCVPFTMNKGSSSNCQSKNIFDTDNACRAVCPALSQCERLRLKNSLVAKRSGQNAWFQPRCDQETGTWSPVQCLGDGKNDTVDMKVCWCADKKGAPVKGSLVKGVEPVCSHRQARRRLDPNTSIEDPLVEALIRQVTVFDENNSLDEFFEEPSPAPTVSMKLLSQLKIHTTRCEAMSTAYEVTCDDNGGFEPLQCSKSKCWCVDEAGNQIPSIGTFTPGGKQCSFVPIDAVEVELGVENSAKIKLENLYDVIKDELSQLLEAPFNVRVRENDEKITIKFDLVEKNKVDQAFALEEAIKHQNVTLYNAQLRPDITLSSFIHRTNSYIPSHSQLHGMPSNPFYTVVFILATTSAFIVSLFVIYVMLKRGKSVKNYDNNKSIVLNDKNLDYTSPIFVLSPNEKNKSEMH